MNAASTIISPGARMDGEISFLQSWGGWIVAVVLGFFGLVPKLRKAQLDENGQAILAWQQLCSQLSDDNAKLRTDNAQLREDNRAFRERIATLENDGRERDREIRDLRKQVDGLQRDLAQHSQSTAVLMDKGRER